MSRYRGIARLIIVFLSLVSGSFILAQELRPLTVDDLLASESVGTGPLLTVAMSPDGENVAFVRLRPALSQLGSPASWGLDRGDIWLASVAGGEPINLTFGARNKTGYWSPVWSPDGARLAIFSERTKGGDITSSLWIWEKTSGKLNKLVDEDVDFSQKPVWVDSERVAFLLHSVEPLSQPKAGLENSEKAARDKARNGETTASVLDTQVMCKDKAINVEDRLLLVNAINGKTQTLGDIPSDIGFPTPTVIKSSPNGRYLAIIKVISRVPPKSDVLLQHETIGPAYRARLEVVDLNGHTVFQEDGLERALLTEESFRWAPDSRSFAFLSGVEKWDISQTIIRGSVDGSQKLLPWDTKKGKPLSLAWVDESSLLLSAEREVQGDGGSKDRVDWWLVPSIGDQVTLTEKRESVPGELRAISANGRIFVGVVDGDVWRLDIATRIWTNLTRSFEPKITGILSPSKDHAVSKKITISSLLVFSSQGALTDYYRINLETGAATKITRPSAAASLSAYSNESETAVFESHLSTGDVLSLVQGAKQQTLVDTNTYLRNIVAGEVRKIDYRGLDGQDLIGWLILPAGYQAGKRYPLVSYVYGGRVLKNTPPAESEINGQLPPLLNMQMLAARGYAVVVPSMPLPPEPDGKTNSGSDPYMELTKGVLPAVEKVVDLGIADPNRLAVMGHSYGGYSTFGLVTQTKIFQAAIAVDGLTDLISNYGIFYPSLRYQENPQKNLFPLSISETGQLRMGNPPWKDIERYVRNSPIFYADRVTTPILMIHGDQDIPVAIEQSEEFFTALYRQNKKARFIRYWGEGHVVTSPANIRDFWNQAYAWLDEFCDISRDDMGNLILDGDHVKSRSGARPLKPEDFARFNEIELRNHPWVTASKQQSALCSRKSPR